MEKKKTTWKTIVKNILFYFFTLFLAGYVLLEAFAPSQTIKIYGFKTYRIQTQSMTGYLNVDDITVLGYIRNEDSLKVGDIITFMTYTVDSRNQKIPITHFIDEIYMVDGITYYKTRGAVVKVTHDDGTYELVPTNPGEQDAWIDANGDPYDLVFSDIVGRHTIKIPIIGKGIRAVQELLGASGTQGVDPIFVGLLVLNGFIVYLVFKIIFTKDKKVEENEEIKDDLGSTDKE